MSNSTVALPEPENQELTEQLEVDLRQAQGPGAASSSIHGSGEIKMVHVRHHRPASLRDKFKIFLAAMALIGCVILLVRVDGVFHHHLFKALAIVAGLVLMAGVNKSTIQ